MGSVYVMITVPSAEHERALWVEKHLQSGDQKKKTSTGSVRENKSCGSFKLDGGFVVGGDSEHLLVRSISEDSVLEKQTNDNWEWDRERAKSAVQVQNHSSRKPMVKRLEKCLKELKIPNAVWVLGKAGKFYQVNFCTAAGEQCEQIIQLLSEHDIGVEHNSNVSILPCTLYFEGKEHAYSPNKLTSPMMPTSSPRNSLHEHRRMKEETGWERFVHSVRERLMVAQVIAGVKSNATFTFDFLLLLIIASMTAAIGLVENSEVTLVASMLISPLMNPVMASTFGFVTKDWKLQSIGVLSELLGLLLCVLIGFLYGISITYLSWESPDFNWPTPEMVYRGGMRSLLVGVLIALLAGAAVAIAVLGNYSCSLTGVAISASLMPPAVNAGLLWALAATAVLLGDTNSERLTSLTSGEPVKELVTLGALSLALTFINIICIFLTGIIVLKIKKVTPRSSKEANKLLMKEQFQFPHDCQCPLSPAERMEQVPRASPFTNVFNKTPYRFGLNQYTWSAYTVQEVNRPRICDLQSAWRQYTYQGQDNSYRPRCHTAAAAADQGYRPAVRGDLTRLWNLTPMSEAGNQTNPEFNNAFIHEPLPGSTQVESRCIAGRKFTITSCNSDICQE